MDTTYRSIAERASKQLGLITRMQLLQIGVSRAVLRRLIAKGVLNPVGARVLCIQGAPSTFERRVLAACLDTGGVASHQTAAGLHQLHGLGALRSEVSVTVMHGRQTTASALARVHTTTWLPEDDRTRIGPIPVTSVARTLFGLAGLVPAIDRDRLQCAVDVAIRDGQASDRWLWWRLEKLRRSGRNGVSVFEAILADRRAGAGVESWLERETLRVFADAGLPEPICQQRIAAHGTFVARVDFLYPECGLIIEVSGHVTHSTREQRQADLHRDNDLELAGYHKLEFTYDDVVRRPEYVVATVAGALAMRARAA